MKKKLTTTIDEHLLKDFKARAKQEKRTINVILEDLMKLYLQYVNSTSA